MVFHNSYTITFTFTHSAVVSVVVVVVVVVVGRLMKYVDSKWQSVADEDTYKLTKLEGQVTVTYQ